MLEPPNNETLNRTVAFKWQPNGPLPPGAAYEVVWWRDDADPGAAAGFAAPTTNTFLTVNLDDFFANPQTVRWTVLIVNAEPYKRLTQTAESSYQRLVYQPANQGSSTTSGEGK